METTPQKPGFGTKLLVGLGAAAVMGVGGCAVANGEEAAYQRDLVAAAEQSDGDAFRLPSAQNGDSLAWDEGVAVCPYAQMEQLPDRFAEAGERLNTDAHEGRAWLLLAEGDDVATIALDRLTVDVCGGSGSDSGGEFVTFTPETEWTAEQLDGKHGTWDLTPRVEPA